jgi:phosphocarrier protein HPr
MSETAITRSVVVTDPAGVHLRTAVAIADVARRSKARVTLTKDDQQASATDVLQIAAMTVERGQTVTLAAVGADAAAALDAIEPLLAGSFGDEET